MADVGMAGTTRVVDPAKADIHSSIKQTIPTGLTLEAEVLGAITQCEQAILKRDLAPAMTWVKENGSRLRRIHVRKGFSAAPLRVQLSCGAVVGSEPPGV